MTASAESGSRWIVAGVVAGVTVAAGVVFFRPPEPAVPVTAAGLARTVAKPAVTLARVSAADQLLQEENELGDLRPLFLPTARNATLPDLRLEPGRTLLDRENMKLIYPDGDLALGRNLPPVALINGRPPAAATASDALADDVFDRSLAGFGREPAELKPVDSRGGFVEVVATRDGRRVLAEQLPLTAKPAGDKAWEPVDYLVAIEAAGLVAPLFVLQGSRVEEVDLHFRNYLARSFRLGERLPPGIYRVTVSP
jgi:hypothetical protein